MDNPTQIRRIGVAKFAMGTKERDDNPRDLRVKELGRRLIDVMCAGRESEGHVLIPKSTHSFNVGDHAAHGKRSRLRSGEGRGVGWLVVRLLRLDLASAPEPHDSVVLAPQLWRHQIGHPPILAGHDAWWVSLSFQRKVL